jgi:hypothetical protein
MVLTVSFVLSPVTGLVCHRHRRLPANLTPASGRQDHTTSPSASGALVLSAARVHCIPPRVRDDRDTPLFRGGTAMDIEVIWVRTKQEYFCKEGWTGSLQKSLSGKSADLSRRAKGPGRRADYAGACHRTAHCADPLGPIRPRDCPCQRRCAYSMTGSATYAIRSLPHIKGLICKVCFARNSPIGRSAEDIDNGQFATAAVTLQTFRSDTARRKPTRHAAQPDFELQTEGSEPWGELHSQRF